MAADWLCEGGCAQGALVGSMMAEGTAAAAAAARGGKNQDVICAKQLRRAKQVATRDNLNTRVRNSDYGMTNAGTLYIVMTLSWTCSCAFLWPAIGRIPRVGRLLRKMRGRQSYTSTSQIDCRQSITHLSKVITNHSLKLFPSGQSKRADVLLVHVLCHVHAHVLYSSLQPRQVPLHGAIYPRGRITCG